MANTGQSIYDICQAARSSCSWANTNGWTSLPFVCWDINKQIFCTELQLSLAWLTPRPLFFRYIASMVLAWYHFGLLGYLVITREWKEAEPCSKRITFVLVIPSFCFKLSSTKCSIISVSNVWHFTELYFQQQETRILGMKSPFPAKLLDVRQ